MLKILHRKDELIKTLQLQLDDSTSKIIRHRETQQGRLEDRLGVEDGGHSDSRLHLEQELEAARRQVLDEQAARDQARAVAQRLESENVQLKAELMRLRDMGSRSVASVPEHAQQELHGLREKVVDQQDQIQVPWHSPM